MPACAGHEVIFIARGEHLRAIRAKGLKVQSVHGDFEVNPAQATDDPAEVGSVDLTIITIKTYDIDSAAVLARPLIGPNTAILPLQSGIEHLEQLGAISAERLGGAVWVMSAVAAPGISRRLESCWRSNMNENREPLLVEIVAYAPTAFYHCTHCEVVWKQTGFSEGLHEEQVKTALPPDLMEDYQAVSDWVHHLMKVHCDRVAIKVIDATSMDGFWRSVRYRLGRYPAVIVAGRRFTGADFSEAEAEITRQLVAVPA